MAGAELKASGTGIRSFCERSAIQSLYTIKPLVILEYDRSCAPLGPLPVLLNLCFGLTDLSVLGIHFGLAEA